MLALVRERFSGPEPADDLEELIRATPACREVDAVGLRLAAAITDCEGHLEAAIGQNVENRALFGEPYGVVQRGKCDCGTEFDRLGASRNRGQRDQRRGRVAILSTVVLRHPGSFEPNAFGPGNELQCLSVQLSPGPVPLLRISEIVEMAE